MTGKINEKLQESVKKENTGLNKKEKNIIDERIYLFFTFFVKKIREDKLYFISFIITILFFTVFSVSKVREAEGIYSNIEKVVNSNNETSSQTVNNNLTEEVDVSNYIGIYSKEYLMSEEIFINNSCSVTSYKIVYQIKKDKSIAKYLVNDCFGTIEMWNGKLSYVSTDGARYISANNINYLFSVSSMKEVDGETYKVDNELSVLKPKQKVKDVEFLFYYNNVILLLNDNLLHIKGDEILYNLKNNYINNGGKLDKKVYKSDIKNQFKFIIFNNGEEKNCYTTSDLSDSLFEDGIGYKIYTINYDLVANRFLSAKEIISRDKSALCDVFNEDLKLLKE